MVSEQAIVIRIIASALIGAAIGTERQLRQSPAGIKTHILVCMGATLFTISSILIGDGADVSRIAAQVAVGIGFIGGGVIYKVKDRVLGLTTAADLWVMAAIGLLVGLGQFYLAFVSAAIVLIVLIFVAAIERVAFLR